MSVLKGKQTQFSDKKKYLLRQLLLNIFWCLASQAKLIIDLLHLLHSSNILGSLPRWAIGKLHGIPQNLPTFYQAPSCQGSNLTLHLDLKPGSPRSLKFDLPLEGSKCSYHFKSNPRCSADPL